MAWRSRGRRFVLALLLVLYDRANSAKQFGAATQLTIERPSS